MPIHGFMDVQSGYSGETAPKFDYRRGFALGNFDLYLLPKITDRVKGLVELNFEIDSEGALGVDAERMQLAYVFSDLLTVWAGRFHSPFGYWNTTFHHGAQIQTSIVRPRFLEFEDGGGILPAHTHGLWATGSKKLAAHRLTYDLYLGNGSRIKVDANGAGKLDPNLRKDDNWALSLGFNLAFNFGDFLEGLRIGIHGLTDEVSSYDANSVKMNTTRMRMYGAFGVYENSGLETMVEYYRFSNDTLFPTQVTGIASWAGFAQIGYHIEAIVTPYFRVEKGSFDSTDPYFAKLDGGNSYTRELLGVRYDLSEKAALKAEVATTSAVSTYKSVRTQFCVRF